MIQLTNVSIAYSGETIFSDANFRINRGERMGLVGVNGSGKSSLLKIIAGELRPTTGIVAVEPGLKVTYLPQDSFVVSDLTLHDEMLSAYADVLAIEARQREAERGMSGLRGEALERLMEEYAHLQAEFDRLGGYTIEREVGAVLHGLGFTPNDMGKPVSNFSGGWQSRIAIGKALLRGPEILLLDEPTNHLDLATTEWLEDYLARFSGALVIVSHDRYFLERTTRRTLEIERGELTDYSGTYSWYVAEKERRKEAQRDAYGRQQRELARQQQFIDRFRYKPTKASAVKSREKMLDRMEKVEAPAPELQKVNFGFAYAGNSGREVMRLSDVSKSYDGHKAMQDVNLLIERGDKFALIGPNGSGKSTFLRLVAGLEEPTEGSIGIGHNVRRSYFAQHQAELLDSGHTVWEEILASAPPGRTVTDLRGLLGRFLFSGDDVDKPVELLSGGERSRVALVKMLLHKSNVLLLDEPTNHLDISTRDVLEDAIRDYPGTVVVASHDRYFLDRIATKVLDVEAGHFTLHVGNYTEYRQHKQGAEQEQTQREQESRPKEQPRAAKPRPRASARDLRKLQQEVEALESEIEQSEERLADVQGVLSDPDLYGDQNRYASVLAEYGELQGRIADLNARWERRAREVEDLDVQDSEPEPRVQPTDQRQKLLGRLRELDFMLRDPEVHHDPVQSGSLSAEYAKVYEHLADLEPEREESDESAKGRESEQRPAAHEHDLDEEAQLRTRLAEIEQALMDPELFTDESRSGPMIEEYGYIQERLQGQRTDSS